MSAISISGIGGKDSGFGSGSVRCKGGRAWGELGGNVLFGEAGGGSDSLVSSSPRDGPPAEPLEYPDRVPRYQMHLTNLCGYDFIVSI